MSLYVQTSHELIRLISANLRKDYSTSPPMLCRHAAPHSSRAHVVDPPFLDLPLSTLLTSRTCRSPVRSRILQNLRRRRAYIVDQGSVESLLKGIALEISCLRLLYSMYVCMSRPFSEGLNIFARFTPSDGKHALSPCQPLMGLAVYLFCSPTPITPGRSRKRLGLPAV